MPVHVQFDWIQYRASFRDIVALRRFVDRSRVEIAVDLRRAGSPAFADALGRALRRASTGEPEAGLPLEDFVPLSRGVVWRFNRRYWEHLPEWEALLGRTYEESLPGGGSDAAHPEAVADSVRELWALVRGLEASGALADEIHALEIGVGTGRRAALWLDAFADLDRQHDTSYYQRLRFHLGDAVLATAERVRAGLDRHAAVTRAVAVDALDPLTALPELRGRCLYVHHTNVYDNLPTDEVAVRGGEVFLVEGRAYLAHADAHRLARTHRVADVSRAALALLDEPAPDVAFWRDLWDALRVEERYVPIDVATLGVDVASLLASAPRGARFHLSQGAVRSFLRTLPLLHPSGLLHVQDLCVADMAGYPERFRGPGKLDGSLFNWVNGALLGRAAERHGYALQVEPFRYREGSSLSILRARRIASGRGYPRALTAKEGSHVPSGGPGGDDAAERPHA